MGRPTEATVSCSKCAFIQIILRHRWIRYTKRIICLPSYAYSTCPLAEKNSYHVINGLMHCPSALQALNEKNHSHTSISFDVCTQLIEICAAKLLKLIGKIGPMTFSEETTVVFFTILNYEYLVLRFY